MSISIIYEEFYMRLHASMCMSSMYYLKSNPANLVPMSIFTSLKKRKKNSL